MLFPPLDKRNICDKAKGLLGHFGEIYRGAGRAIPYRFVHGTTTALMANEYDCISDLCSITPATLREGGYVLWFFFTFGICDKPSTF